MVESGFPTYHEVLGEIKRRHLATEPGAKYFETPCTTPASIVRATDVSLEHPWRTRTFEKRTCMYNVA